MKNTIIGVIGAFLILYVVLIGLGIYNNRIRSEDMENILGQVLKQTLEEGYGQENSLSKQEALVEEIKQRIGDDSTVFVEIHCMDLEKGIISVTVRKHFVQINGKEKELEWTKTAIMDRQYITTISEEEDE